VVAVVDFANLDSAEVVGEVLETHPEATIIGIFVKTEFLFELWSPAITAIAPISCPFKIAPRVTEFYKFDFISIFIGYDLCSKKTIGMLGNKT
jgi:hypothetical protein